MVIERDPENTRFFIPVHVNLINKAGPLIKIELESNDGKFYQIDMEKSVYVSLNLKLDEKLWIKPKRYKVFSE